MTASVDEPFELDTPDGKRIYGLLNRAAQPSGKVVVLSHGLMGHPRDYIHIMAADFFTQHGYDVVRFSYYAEQKEARKLEECTILTHAGDLSQVCDSLRSRYDTLFVAGHSYGGLAMIYANPKATALSFWDSTFLPYISSWKTEAHKLEGTPYYTYGWGFSILINPAMIDHDKQMTEASTVALAKKITTSSQVILAGDVSENPVRTIIYDSLECPKTFADIEGADHLFTNGNTAHTLLQTTLEWFDAH